MLRRVVAPLPRLAPMAMAVRVCHGHAGRRSFQPFTAQDEQQLVSVITTKPRHVLKHVRQLVWRGRKRELHFRSTVTQLMVVLQDFLRKQLIDPQHATAIMEGVIAECVKFSQHDMAHLLFRALLRFRRHGCTVSVESLRLLMESYKGTENTETMLQLANELRGDPDLRAVCIAAYLFAGHAKEAEELRASVPPTELSAQDMVALCEGYVRQGMTAKVTEIVDTVDAFGKTQDELMEVFTALFKLFHRRNDDEAFAHCFDAARRLGVPFNSVGFAAVLRMQMRHARSAEDVSNIERELRALGYVPDLTGNSVIIAAYARMMHYGDKASEEVMLSKVDTLLSSIEGRVKDGDPEMEVSPAHLRAVIRGYGAAGRPELMKAAWDRMQHQELCQDTRVFNELLKWYSLMGNIKDVLAVKAQMASQQVQPDAVTYTWLFRALGRWYPRQVLKYYEEMQEQRVRPDGPLYTTLLGTFGDLQEYAKVEELRAEVAKREEAGTLQVHPTTYAVLLRVYASDLAMVEAIFKEAQEKAVADHDHVVTALLHAYATHADGEAKLESALSALPQWTTNVYNVLLHMYGKRGDQAKVQELMDRMQAEGADMNEVTFGTLITVFGRWKQTDKVAAVVEMLKAKEGMISANFYSVLAATYSRMGDSEGIDDAWEDLLSSKLFPDTETFNAFLALYGKHHNLPKMQLVMDSMLRQVPPNPLTATTVVDLLGKAGRIQEMETLLQDMRENPDTAPTAVTYHQAMNAYAKAADVAKMERVRDDLMAHGFTENAVTFNILAEGYGRAKRFEQLLELRRRRAEQQVPMEELGYCVLISAYGRVRLAAEVAKLAAEVTEAAAEAPELLTRKVRWALVDAFCRCNDVASMQHWIASLDALTPAERMSLVAYYCRTQQLDAAEAQVAAAEADGDDATFGALNALAKGYGRAGRFDKCVEMLHKMRDRGLCPDAATALSLSQQFLRAGLHDQAQQIVQWRRQHGKPHGDDGDDVIV